MTFPATPLDLTAELYLAGAWTDVTSLVYARDLLTVARGRSSEGAHVDRSTCKATINNRSGNFSPRNPTGAYYGQLGRNTPLRVRVGSGLAYLATQDALDTVTTPDSANLSITGDIDIRVDIRRDDWSTAAGLAYKYNTVGDQRSWAFAVNAAGELFLRWSPDGTLASSIEKTSTAAVTVPASGRLALRVTLDVDNGAAGNDVRFYTAPTIGGTWTQLGSTVTTAGTTSIFDSTAALTLGGVPISGLTDGPVGAVRGFRLYQGIAGTLRADTVIGDGVAVTAASFADSQANTWTLAGAVHIVNPGVRFTGEVSEWPSRWDVTGTDVYVPVEASGILRRLTQGATPLRSTLFRALTSLANPPKAYWPGEDGASATRIASGLGGPPMQLSGVPTFAAFDGFACSAPLPQFNGSDWYGPVPAYTGTGTIRVWCLLFAPPTPTFDRRLITLHCTGTAPEWVLEYQAVASTGTFRLFAYAAGVELLDSGTISFDIDDKLLRVGLQLVQDGADVDWTVSTWEAGATAGETQSGTLAGRTVSQATAVRVNVVNSATDEMVMGHVSVHDDAAALADFTAELDAYAGETAGRRVERLCDEEAIAFRAVGDLDATATMGPQLPDDLVTLLRDAADADGGILYEPRDLFGLAYRTREDLYRQRLRLELDYSAAHLSSIEPTDDDRHVRNDVTVERDGGSSARKVATSGPLSVDAPPDGVGRYDTSETLNLEHDGQLGDAAGWLLHLGTVDEARYPVLTVDLARSVFAADTDLTAAVRELDVGDRLTVDSPPAWLPPDAITQLAQGFVETMANFTHRVDVNCAPESPWAAPAVYDDDEARYESRYASDGSTLAEALTTTETDVDVATAAGPLWSHDDGDFKIRVGGEVMTVTAVSGASSPQTFTCTRSVNGVVKAHSSGADVALDHPSVYVR